MCVVTNPVEPYECTRCRVDLPYAAGCELLTEEQHPAGPAVRVPLHAVDSRPKGLARRVDIAREDFLPALVRSGQRKTRDTFAGAGLADRVQVLTVRAQGDHVIFAADLV